MVPIDVLRAIDVRRMFALRVEIANILPFRRAYEPNRVGVHPTIAIVRGKDEVATPHLSARPNADKRPTIDVGWRGRGVTLLNGAR